MAEVGQASQVNSAPQPGVRFVSVFRAGALTVALALGASVLCPGHVSGQVWTVGWFLVAAVLCFAGPLHVEVESPGTVWRGLLAAGTAAALVTAVWSRTVYLTTVPAGYGYEVLNFVRFAHSLVERGFPYEPYSWYAHTLFSYAIAAVLLVVPDEILAMRIAAALISIVTVCATVWCAKALFGREAAWVTAALLSVSSWHVWTSRNGYHQFLMPLFQSLVVGGLVVGLRDGSWRALAVASAAMILGLHAYWGLYLMPVYAGLLAFAVWWWFPDRWQRSRRAFWASAAVATVGSTPVLVWLLFVPEGLSYLWKSLLPERVGAPTFGSKIPMNLRYLREAFLPAVPAMRSATALLDGLTWAGVVVGVVLGLRRLPRDLAALAVLLLVGVYILGLVLSVANEFYVGSLLLPLYLLAGLAYASAIGAWRQVHPVLGGLIAVAVFAGAWAYQIPACVEHFFRILAVQKLRGADRPEAQGYLLLEHLRGHSDLNRFVPSNEPGKDFEGEALSLGDHLTSYRWLHAVGRLHSGIALFPPVWLREGRDAVLYVPRSPHVERFLLPLWRQMYAGLEQRDLLPPPPWLDLGVGAFGWEIRIPWPSLRSRLGALQEGGEAAGHLWVANDGLYELRPFVPGAATIILHERELKVGEAVYLEEGYHPVRFSSSGFGWSGWQIRMQGGPWQPLDLYLVHGLVARQPELQPYESSIGAAAQFRWGRSSTIPMPETPIALVAPGGREVWAVLRTQAQRVPTAGTPSRSVQLPEVQDFQPVFGNDTLELFAPQGTRFRVEPPPVERLGDDLPCRAVAVFATAHSPLAVCRDGTLLVAGREPVPLRAGDGAPLVQVVAAARGTGEILLIDAALGQLLAYSLDGTLLRWRVVPRVWWDSQLALDADGNLYLRRWVSGWRMYNPRWDLLFDPSRFVPLVFAHGETYLTNLDSRWLTFAADSSGAVAAFLRGNSVDLYRQQPVP